MLKMFSFGIDTRTETFVPLIYCVIDNTLFQVMPDVSQASWMSVANASLHASVPKETF